LAANSGVDIGDVTLTAGTAAIGKLAANANVDIGDVGTKQYGTVACGERQGSASAVQLPSVVCKSVAIAAVGDNVGNVYLGGASVTVPDGTTDTTTGLELQPGDMTQFIPVANLNQFYIICDNAGDDITYLAVS
jgi:hypothetical protein